MKEIVVGLIRRPHGLRGEVHLQIETDFPERVFAAGRVLRLRPVGGSELDETGPVRPPYPQALTVESARPAARGWLAAFRELASREEAERVRGLTLAVGREELEEPEAGEYFLFELVGLEVRDDESGRVIGCVEAVYEAAAHPLLGVRHGGRERLIPFHPAVVRAVDRAAGAIRIHPPAGLLEL